MSILDTGHLGEPRRSLFRRGGLAALLLIALGVALVRFDPDGISSGCGRSGLVDIAQGMVVEVLLLGPMTTTRLSGS
ncbi:MAG: hypothetical protein PSV13_18125, partial [Lacunisphaera sp.]|nr:hypothetical protein [Lacunisphaera sp.]